MRLNQVMVSARDLDASVAFYRTLGLRLIVRSEDYARFECPDGESTFSLHLEPNARGVSETLVYSRTRIWMGLLLASRPRASSLRPIRSTSGGCGARLICAILPETSCVCFMRAATGDIRHGG